VALIAAQVLGAALTAVMGGIHLDLWEGGYRDIPTIGVLFLLNSIGAVLLAIALLVTPVRLLGFVSAGGALFTAGTLAALIASFTVGVFGFREYLAVPLVVTTIIVEAAGTGVLTDQDARGRAPRISRARAGTTAENPHLGFLLVEFGADLIGLHINGTARSVTGTQRRGSSGAGLRLQPASPCGQR